MGADGLHSEGGKSEQVIKGQGIVQVQQKSLRGNFKGKWTANSMIGACFVFALPAFIDFLLWLSSWCRRRASSERSNMSSRRH